MKIQIRNKDIGLVAKILYMTSLTFTQARVRDQFLKKLGVAQDVFEDNRMKLVNALAMKDDKDQLIQKEEIGPDGKPMKLYDFTDENRAKFEKEYEILTDEKIDFSVDDQIFKFIERTKYTPFYGEAEVIDEIFNGNSTVSEENSAPTADKKQAGRAKKNS